MSLFPLLDGVRDWVRRARWTPERALAARGEDLAMRYVQKMKYVVVARNFRSLSGASEVDLIGWDGDRLAFIEVKTRTGEEDASPERAVGERKQKSIARAAREYADLAGVDGGRVRFDVVTVLAGKTVRVELFRDAFQAVG